MAEASFFLDPDYMVSFSPGLNFAPPNELKYCCDYMLNFSPCAKRKFPSLQKRENTIDAHACVPFSARDEKKRKRLHGFFSLFGRAENLTWFENTGLGFLARAESLSM